MKKFNWKKIGVIFIIVLLASDVAASFFFYNLAIQRGPKDFLSGNRDLKVSAATMEEFLEGDWRVWVRNQPFEEMEMTSRDGLQLTGYYLPAAEPTDQLVIFTHGYLGNAKQMGLYGQFYYEELGYNIFMADARGHNRSEGDYYGFGWHDRHDVIDWTAQLIDHIGDQVQIVYHGLSMGAATVLMASGDSGLPDNVQAIIADSPYSSVYQLFAYQMNRMFHLPAFPILDSTSIVTQLKADYSLREADAMKEVAKTNVPILYIHGKGDTFVPTEMSLELYENTNSEADTMLVDGANHGEAFVMDKEKYKARVIQFLHQHVQ